MKIKLSLLLLLLLLSSLVLSPATISAEVPDELFAPYVDVSLWPTPSLVDIYEQTGQKYFTLAFVLEGDECTPAWAGLPSLDMDFYQAQIGQLREVGGDVIISFGGANGTELALGCESEERILQAYQEVIDRYNVQWVDFDIEGWAVAHRESIDRRSRVIQQLQLNNPDLKIAFCLPALPQGLTNDGLYVIQSALNAGVRIDLVNVMAMDYGDGAAPDPEGRMGQYAIDAAQNTYNQMLNLGLDTQIGVTPMIGQNDVPTERFYLQDGIKLLNWAKTTSWVSLLSMWSTGRDNGNCTPGTLSPQCSGISQDDYAFTNLFKAYTEAGSGGNLWPIVEITNPTDGQAFDDNPDITIEADAADSDGSIIQVEFFAGTSSLGVDTEHPYSVVWQSVPAGIHDITAIATDEQGAEVQSAVVAILVGSDICLSEPWSATSIYTAGDTVSHNNKEWEAKWWSRGEEPGTTGPWGVWKELGACNGGGQNQPPTAAITAPQDGHVYESGQIVTLEASASDSDGSIVQVEFFRGDTSLGVATQSPYRVEWADVPAGNHQLKAVATDDQSEATESAVVSIKVTGDTGGACGGLLNYPAGIGTYQFGQQVQNNGYIYEVREHPYGGWTNIDAPSYYEPGVGIAWQDAWYVVSPCP
ncbi:MAG: hypothetical protein GY759_15895 [Chloroflexi bacterium]|nr:hypothetical protein [Chloroflexota bacterium]